MTEKISSDCHKILTSNEVQIDTRVFVIFSALLILSEFSIITSSFNSITYTTKIDNEFFRRQWCPSYLGGRGGGGGGGSGGWVYVN